MEGKLLINKQENNKQVLNEQKQVVTQKFITVEGSYVGKDGNVLMNLKSVLYGDGATPTYISFGTGDTIEGYNDDGSPILSDLLEKEQKQVEQQFMAYLIKEQKAFSKENGIDPSVVNIIDAEKENK